MKDSGIEWIGEIPADWDVVYGKHHFSNKKTIPGIHSVNFDRLALTLKGVVLRSKEDSDGLQPKDFDTYQLLSINELVFKLIDLQNTSTSQVGLAHNTGLVSPAYIVLHPNHRQCHQCGGNKGTGKPSVCIKAWYRYFQCPPGLDVYQTRHKLQSAIIKALPAEYFLRFRGGLGK